MNDELDHDAVDVRSAPLTEARGASAAGVFGMKLFLASLGVLMAASLVGYVVVRSRATAWPPPGAPALPKGLWLSTLLVIGISAVMQRALSAARRGQAAALRSGLLGATALAVAFLAVQAFNWSALMRLHTREHATLFEFTFYMLTGLHALHVIGGIVPLVVVSRKAIAGAYAPAQHPGVLYCTMYWHFLDVVWIVMFAALMLA